METPEEAEVKVYIDDNKPEVEQVWWELQVFININNTVMKTFLVILGFE